MKEFRCPVPECVVPPTVVDDDGNMVRLHCDVHGVDTYETKEEVKTTPAKIIKVDFSLDRYMKKK